jgi:hypothetical protein
MIMESTDSLKVISDSLNVVAQQAGTPESNRWIWLVIVSVFVILLLIIIVLVHRRTKTKPVDNLDMLKQQAKEQGNVDFSNVINSAFNSKQLYDKLKVKCHPDRFPLNPEKNAIANDIFQRIKKNEYNVEELEKLKDEAIERLGISI